ncbi:MAG: SDR family oxidoreductase [Sedimentisphaerales bacterium]|nr:SDR family oxidoreductase [Sedimentisphaerales bacterium]
MIDLTGKIALVIGGGGGIGLEIAKALAVEGCNVALADYNEELLKNAEKTAGGGVKFAWKACDITNRDQVAELYKWLGKEVGSIDILVNCAGINVVNRMMANVDPKDFDRIMSVNTTGAFNCLYEAVPVMREKKSGLIINIVSIAGRHTIALAGLPYVASKFATSAMGKFIGLEERENGINVTNIYPGEANTPIIDKRPVPVSAEKRAQMLQPEDIAECVVMVAKLHPRAIVPELVITPKHMLYP